MGFSEEQTNWLKENGKLLESGDYQRIFVKAQYGHKNPKGELLGKLQNKKEFLEFLRSSGKQFNKKEIKKLEKEIKSLEKTILKVK